MLTYRLTEKTRRRELGYCITADGVDINQAIDVAKQQSASVVALSLAALQIRSKKSGGTPNDYVEQVLGERRRIASVYEERMKKNYASSGQAFSDDPLMKGDLMFCKELTEAMSR